MQAYQVLENFKNLNYVDIKILFLLLFLGTLGFLIHQIDYGLDVLFVAFILGISTGYFMQGETKNRVNRVLKFLLPISIALYGFNISVPMLSPRLSDVVATLAIFSTIFLSVYFFSMKLGNGKKLSILLSCGSGICGVSAIAIVSSIIKPSKGEFSSAIIAITVAGLICAILYPPFAKYLFPDKFYLLAGSSLPQTALVKIATSVFGENDVTKALSVKAIRIAMIAVVAFIISFLYSEKGFYIPWFIVAFLMTAFLSSNFSSPEVVRTFSTILFASTLAGIGVTVDLKEIYSLGLKPLIAVFLGTAVAIAVFLIFLAGGLI
ncbi:MAG: putative sulfate exporter family transporter [Archaeoglobaceae archaeon]